MAPRCMASEISTINSLLTLILLMEKINPACAGQPEQRYRGKQVAITRHLFALIVKTRNPNRGSRGSARILTDIDPRQSVLIRVIRGLDFESCASALRF